MKFLFGSIRQQQRWFLPALLFLCTALSADTVILKNGVILEGLVYDQNPYMLRVQQDKGSAITIRKSQVIRVIYGDRPVKDLEEKPAKPETTERKPPRTERKDPPRTTEKIVTERKPEPEKKEPQKKEEPEELQIIMEPSEEPIKKGPETIRKDVAEPVAEPLSSPYVANLSKRPPGISKKELSRAHSLKYGEGENTQELILRDEPRSPVIDLNRIVVGPVEPDAQGRLRIHSDDQGKPVALVEVDYSRAGLNVPQAIRDGRILEHEVLLRDHEGQILGRAPLNFSSFRFEKITEQRKARRFLILPNATSVTVEEAEDPEPETRIVAHIRNYTDRDAIPQSIELKHFPDSEYPVSLQVRMTLIDPYVISLCKECLEDPLYAKARQDYQEALAKLRELEANPDLLQEDSAEKAPHTVSRLAHEKADEYRDAVRRSIEKMNRASHRIKDGKIENHTSDGNFIQYREWHLYSRPYFFRISSEKAGK